MTTREIVIQLLSEIKPTANLEKVEDIIDGAYLDSLELMALITALMERFGFELDIDWISSENFNSVDAITALVERVRPKEANE